MKFSDFETILSSNRLKRYLEACDGDSRKAMTLYRYNLQVSQEMFTLVSCFEVALRNAIDRKVSEELGENWLRDSVADNGIFTNPKLKKTHDIIRRAFLKLYHEQSYSASKLLAEMEFGIWKYMFSPIQYRMTGRNLLKIFPNKPKSTSECQYNQTFIFNELDKVNSLRNRIAHHEPICFPTGKSEIDTSYILNIYIKIHRLFMWMGVDARALLYGLDHVQQVCNRINMLKNRPD